MKFGPLGGAALLATGRARGIERFGATPQSFLASLAPLIALPLVGTVMLLLSGYPEAAVSTFLLTLVAQLTPPVASHALAVRWGREEQWLRYATAFNWCQWAIPIAGFLIVLLLQMAGGGQMTEDQVAPLMLVGVLVYGLWLHWMIARHGLALPGLWAAGVVLLVNAATIALVLLPRLVGILIG